MTRDPASSDASARVALCVLLAALTFNAILCFVNTSIAAINDTTVMGVELLLISIALFNALGREPAPYVVLAVFLSYVFLLMALRPSLDPKAVRDFLIPIVFYLFGRRLSDPALADRAALASGLIVFVFGCFEFIALDTYVQYFNIIRYYIARGTVSPAELTDQTSSLFASGMRPDARAILPFLGPHRASSVFLEPVSTGNFGAIIYLWTLCRGGMRWRWVTMATGIGAIILSDARFGGFVCIAGTITFFALSRTPRAFWLALPFTFLSALAIYGFVTSQIDWENNFAGRMLWAARLVTSLSEKAVWGLSPDKPFLSDCGYAYSLNQIGLIGCIGFWCLFIFLPENSRRSWTFKACVATYISMLLLISDSVYSIKTAALLWFMLGSSDGFREDASLQSEQDNTRAPISSRFSENRALAMPAR